MSIMLIASACIVCFVLGMMLTKEIMTHEYEQKIQKDVARYKYEAEVNKAQLDLCRTEMSEISKRLDRVT